MGGGCNEGEEVRGQWTVDSGQWTGDRGQGTGDRGQGTGDRGQGWGWGWGWGSVGDVEVSEGVFEAKLSGEVPGLSGGVGVSGGQLKPGCKGVQRNA